ncbi:hypothetical protein ACU18_18825 [Arthrobacter sp. ZBG10]|nr:hypothetical protein ACU18_18825 [Arthrobacter sp. ZBG10]
MVPTRIVRAEFLDGDKVLIVGFPPQRLIAWRIWIRRQGQVHVVCGFIEGIRRYISKFGILVAAVQAAQPSFVSI